MVKIFSCINDGKTLAFGSLEIQYFFIKQKCVKVVENKNAIITSLDIEKNKLNMHRPPIINTSKY
jgi:hypothetical protein